MRLTEHVALVGGGRFGLSNSYDCSVYALDFGEGVVLIDSGSGLEPELVEANFQGDGIGPDRVRAIVLTHGHADHAGGCKAWKNRTGCQIYAARRGARGCRRGSDAISGRILETAKLAGIYPSDYLFEPVGVDTGVHDGDVLKFGALEIHAVEVAGHSAHHICYWG